MRINSAILMNVYSNISLIISSLLQVALATYIHYQTWILFIHLISNNNWISLISLIILSEMILGFNNYDENSDVAMVCVIRDSIGGVKTHFY